MKANNIRLLIGFLVIAVLTSTGCKSGSIAVKSDDCKINGGFEVVESGLPANWNYYSPKTVRSGDFDIVSDNTESKEGNRSLKFDVRECEATGGRYSPGFFSEFRVIPGETYRVRFCIINKGCRFRVKVETGMQGNPGILEDIMRTQGTIAQWKYVEHYIIIPANNDNLRFEANILSQGTIWFDDISIEGVNNKNELTLYPYRGYEECK